MIKILISLCLFLGLPLLAQNSNEFDNAFSSIKHNTAERHISKALLRCDSLQQASSEPYYKAKTLLLSASIYRKLGHLKAALHHAKKADSLLSASKNLDLKTEISTFTASLYRLGDLQDQHLSQINQSVVLSRDIPNSPERYINNIYIQHEIASYYLSKNKYKKALDHLEIAKAEFANLPSTFAVDLSSTNHLLLGNCYLALGNIITAEHHYKAVLATAKIISLSTIGSAYNGLALIDLQKLKYERSRDFINKAKVIAKQSYDLWLQEEVLTTENLLFVETNDINNLKHNKEALKKVEKTRENQKIEFIDSEFNKLFDHKNSTATSNSVKNVIISLAVIILLFFILIFILLKKRQKTQFQKFKSILERSRQNSLPIASEEIEAIINPEKRDKPNAENEIMPIETQQKLQISLEEFEKGVLFTSNNMSLPYLASQLNTNTKYLSYIIKTYRQRDFNSYINELRINYIINKLENNSKYRQYKISVLAEEAGFSSHSKFTSVFKKVTDMSPSSFISYLDELNNL